MWRNSRAWLSSKAYKTIKVFEIVQYFRGRTIKVFMSGDYEFLCRIYGLSGASGICITWTFPIKAQFIFLGWHNCLWCLITSGQLKTPLEVRGRQQARTLQSLHQDHRRFTQQGDGDTNKAKLYNNVIMEPLLEIPLSNVRSIEINIIGDKILHV